MTLLDAKEYHPEKERQRRTRAVYALVAALVLIALVWWNRYWPQKHVADNFFASLERQDYEAAYGIYFADPSWRQHPQNHAQYPLNEFKQDWGPGGEWGLIKSYRIFGESNCPGGGSGVVVDVVVNDRAQHAQVYVDKSDKTISTPPCDLEFR
ncbi:MAG TPA: hypothetical protein VND65_09480 [Candidatus Binatia bacterium]|nr:hypothetical protein [Candidatus Binatia bacterium]